MVNPMKLTLAVAALVLAGCGDNTLSGTPAPGDQTPGELAYGLDDAYWTQDNSNEQPGFGETYFQDALGADAPVTDALADSGDVDTPPGADVFLLRVVWGRRCPSAPTKMPAPTAARWCGTETWP